jgi:hypothetical protein
MRRVLVLLFASAMMAAMPAAAQQSLGDVAGSIKLKRPQGEAVVVDGSSLTRTSGPSRSSLSGDLEAVLTDSRDAARDLAAMLEDLPRITRYQYSDEQRARLEELAFGLETARNNVAMFFGVEGVQDIVEKAESGVAEAQQALASAQAAVGSASWVPNDVRRLAEHGAKLLDDALADLRKLQRAGAAAQTPPTIDPIAADASIRGLCGQSSAEGSDRHRECDARQRAAIDNIMGRSALASGLDDAAFNTIRNQCRAEWVHDFVARDGCERRRVASAGGR